MGNQDSVAIGPYRRCDGAVDTTGDRSTRPTGRARPADPWSPGATARPDLLLDQVEIVLRTIALPDYHEDDPIAGRERFYRRHILTPGRWLRVVVDFNEIPGWIVTVLVQDTDPRTS